MLQRFVVLDEHDDPPVEVRAPVADSQRRQGRTVWRAARGGRGTRRNPRPSQRRGPGVGQVVLAEAKLPPQPPEQGLIEEHEPGEAGEVPGQGVAALDVRPLVRQAEPELLGSPPSQSARGSRITGRAQV